MRVAYTILQYTGMVLMYGKKNSKPLLTQYYHSTLVGAYNIFKAFEHDILPLSWGVTTKPIFTMSDTIHRRANHSHQIYFLVECITQGLGRYQARNRVFPINFHHRPYNSVMQYCTSL